MVECVLSYLLNSYLFVKVFSWSQKLICYFYYPPPPHTQGVDITIVLGKELFMGGLNYGPLKDAGYVCEFILKITFIVLEPN